MSEFYLNFGRSYTTFVDDDHIETIIKVQYHLETLEEPFSGSDVFELPQEIIEDLVNHGLNEEGQLACCRRTSDVGLVDCVACLDEAWKTFCNSLDPSSCGRAEGILRLVSLAKEHGLKKSDLTVRCHRFIYTLPLINDI